MRPLTFPSSPVTRHTSERVPRDWGEERLILRTPTYVGKILTRRAGTTGGLQYHVKQEDHYLLSGQLRLRHDPGTGQLTDLIVTPGDGWHVPPLAVHQEEALADSVVFDVSDPTRDDRVRCEALYGFAEGGDSLPSMSPDQARVKLEALAATFRARALECERLAAYFR